MSSDSITLLLSAAARLDDTELAVAVEGLISKRPVVRAVLLNVWRAEDAVGVSVAPAQGLRTNNLAQSVQGAGVVVSQSVGTGQASGECLVSQACVYAARSGSKKLSSDHVLAAAVHAFPQEARESFGAELHTQLEDLLKKSGLEALPEGTLPRGGESLARDPYAEKLLSILGCAGVMPLFAALQRLPDQAAATQLLEMARIFAQSAATARGPLAADSEQQPLMNGGDGDGEGEGEGDGDGGLLGSHERQRGRVLLRVRCFAAHNGARTAGTEHVLAAALELFPAAAQAALSEPVQRHLSELLEKSQLEPPPEGAPQREDLPVDEDALLLLGLPEGESYPMDLFLALLKLPDAAAATQLIEMAKIFADRS